jgi:hypothetical protein
MKALQSLQFDAELSPELVTPYLGVFTDTLHMTEEQFEFILEAAELARDILYGD